MAKRDNTQEVKQTETSNAAEHATVGSSPYSEMLRQAAKVQTAYRTGGPLKLLDSRFSSISSREFAIPGILVYKWYPTAGVATSATDPVNMAIKTIYSFVRAANSGARNYQPSDLFIYTTALDSLYSLYYQISRVVGVLNQVTPLNTYYPEALVSALGFDYADFVDHQPEIIFQMANWKAKLAQFSLPATMRLYQDHRDMNSTIYTDGETARAQLYAFVQDGFWTYEVVDEVKGLTVRRLEEFEFESTSLSSSYEYLASWAAVKAMFNTMLAAFLNSDDVALISGDITKAYATAGFVDLPLLTNEYVTPIGKSDFMLHAIMNADIVPVSPNSCRVYDSPTLLGYVECHPKADPATDLTWAAKQYANYKVTNSVPRTDNPWNAIITRMLAGAIYLGNTPWENLVDDNPTDENLIAAMRFRTWVDNFDIGVVAGTSLLPILQSIPELGAFFADGPEFIVQANPMARVNVQHCGTEIIHDAEFYALSSVPLEIDTAGTVSAANRRNVSSFIEAGGLTFQATRDGAGGIKAIADPVRAQRMNTVLATLSGLSVFDWHHRVYAADSSGVAVLPSARGSAMTQAFADTQNVVPIGRENVQQYVDAALYHAFFD